MPENSHRQKYNGFSFAFRLTGGTSDHRKETEKDGFSSGNELQCKKRKGYSGLSGILDILHGWRNCRHLVSSSSEERKIVTWKLISTSQYCKDKDILRTFRLTFTRIGKTWRRIVILEISSDVISIKHHVGYILPDVTDYIDIRIPALVV